MTIDLNSFGPWRDDICESCETVHLVVGPEGGPFYCKDCWMGERIPRQRRVSDRTAPPLFDVAPYEQRKGGA